MNTFGITLCLSLLAAIGYSEARECATDCAKTCALIDFVCPGANQCVQIKIDCSQLCLDRCHCEMECESHANVGRVKCEEDVAKLPKLPGPLANLPALPVCQAEEVLALRTCSGKCGVKVATGAVKMAIAAAKEVLNKAVTSLQSTLSG